METGAHGPLFCCFAILHHGQGRHSILGYTALHAAADQGHMKVVRHLLKFGADTEVQRAKTLETPLFFAAQSGRMAIVECLLEAGASKRARNAQGRYAWEIAVEYQPEKPEIGNVLRNPPEPPIVYMKNVEARNADVCWCKPARRKDGLYPVEYEVDYRVALEQRNKPKFTFAVSPTAKPFEEGLTPDEEADAEQLEKTREARAEEKRRELAIAKRNLSAALDRDGDGVCDGDIDGDGIADIEITAAETGGLTKAEIEERKREKKAAFALKRARGTGEMGALASGALARKKSVARQKKLDKKLAKLKAETLAREAAVRAEEEARKPEPWATIKGIEPPALSFQLSKLKPGCKYEVRVRARNNAGFGDFSGEKVLFTAFVEPARMEKTLLVCSDAASITLRWKAPNDNGRPIDKFGMQVQNCSDADAEWRPVLAAFKRMNSAEQVAGMPPQARQHRVVGLSSGKAYRFRVRAHNAAGWPVAVPRNT